MEQLMKKKRLLSLAFVAVLSIPGAALATNGYFLPGYGAKAMGMGGVGVAFPQDALASATNPAGISQVGSRVDIGMALFNPLRRSAVWSAGNMCPNPDNPSEPEDVATCNAIGFAGDSWSKNRVFLLPNMGMSFDLSDDITLGFAMVGNGGMNTTYKGNFFKNPSTLVGASAPFNATDKIGVDMAQLLIPISVAYKIHETQTIAGSLVLARQRFSIRGLEYFGAFPINTNIDKLTNKGAEYSNGYGVRLGWLGKFFKDRLSLGATWASRTYMNEFKKYEGLFAEKGDFDIPANYAVGLAFNVTPEMTVALDLEKILYSKIKSIGNRGPGALVPALVKTLYGDEKNLGNPGGMGFGWTDQTVVKVGFNYKYSDALTLRTGYNFGKSPIPDDQLTFNLLAPGLVEKHFSVGFTYNPSDDTEVTMAYTRAMRNKQSKCGLALIDCAEIEMYQNVLDVGFGLKF